MFSKLTNVVAFAAFALPVVRATTHTTFLSGYEGMPVGGKMLPIINTQESVTEGSSLKQQVRFLDEVDPIPNASNADWADEDRKIKKRRKETMVPDGPGSNVEYSNFEHDRIRNKAKEHTTNKPRWMRENVLKVQEKFMWPFFEVGLIRDTEGTKRVDPFWRLAAGLGLGVGAKFTADAIKDHYFGNEYITNSLGMEGEVHDLHDVMFQNATHDELANNIQYEHLQVGIYAYIMTGAVMAALALCLIMHYSGIKLWVSATCSMLVLGSAALTAGGFCTHMYNATDVWYTNEMVVIGLALGSLFVLIGLGWSIYSCFKSHELGQLADLAPKANDLIIVR